MDPLGFYDFNHLLKESFCVVSDSGTAAEEGLFYNVPNVSLRIATERPETVESGATIISGMDLNNIVESVETTVSLPWSAKDFLFFTIIHQKAVLWHEVEERDSIIHL